MCEGESVDVRGCEDSLELGRNQFTVPQATQQTNPTFFFEHGCSKPGVESMVNSTVVELCVGMRNRMCVELRSGVE